MGAVDCPWDNPMRLQHIAPIGARFPPLHHNRIEISLRDLSYRIQKFRVAFRLVTAVAPLTLPSPSRAGSDNTQNKNNPTARGMTLELIITGAAVIVLVAVLAWAVTVKCKTQGVNDQSPSTKNQKNLGLTPISELNAASDGPWFVYDTTTEAEALR